MNTEALKYGVIGIAAILGIYLVFKASQGIAKTAAVVGKVADSVNPLNNDNVFYQTTNAVTGLATGNTDTTFGGWLYDTFSSHADDVDKMLKGTPTSTVAPTVAQKAMQAAPVISANGVLTDSKFRDMVR